MHTDDAEATTTIPTIWHYLAAADRETFLSGSIAWLLDPQGDHGLGSAFANRVLKALGVRDVATDRIGVAPEERGGRDRRFDIMLKADDKHLAVLEVKAKTSGSAHQLHKYAETVPYVGRVGFEESWNFPDLTDEEREQFRLIRFSEICEVLDDLTRDVENRRRPFIRGLVEHLREEEAAVRGLEDYYMRGLGEPPTRPHVHRYSDRSANGLYWRWFKDRWEAEDLPTLDWHIGSERSGNWLSAWEPPLQVDADEQLSVPGTPIQLHGPFRWHPHVEIWNQASLFGEADEDVGELRLKLMELPPGRGGEIYNVLAAAASELSAIAARGRRHRPKEGESFTALWWTLRRKDLRYSSLKRRLLDLINQAGQS